MEHNEQIDLTKRKYTSRLIVERALYRGWDMTGFKSNPAVFKVNIPGKTKPVFIFSASPPQMSYPASKIAKNKQITNCLLAEEGLPVPAELLINYDDKLNVDELENFINTYKKIVVKPLDAAHGKGITVNVESLGQMKDALTEANLSSDSSSILAQEQVDGVDIRVVCINYEFVDSISRIPAQVVGDGENTIEKLITTTNNHPDRGENYKAKLNYIPIDKARQYLGDKKMQSTPKAGEKAQVIGVSNIGMGGERYNIKNQIPEFLKNMAIEASKTIGLPVCGVDFMVSRLPKPEDTIGDLRPKIIELNECPMLTMYDDINSPEQYDVIDKYLDCLSGD